MTLREVARLIPAKPAQVIPAQIIAGQPEHTVMVTETVCDQCGRVVTRYYLCAVCGRDLCGSSECYMYDPRDAGDYPGKMCRTCYALYTDKFAARFASVDRAAEKAEEAILEAWKTESLNTKGTDG